MENIAAIAELVGANVDNIVFLDSVTAGQWSALGAN